MPTISIFFGIVVQQAGIVFGAVTSPGDIHLAPDAMYDEISKGGVSVLT